MAVYSVNGVENGKTISGTMKIAHSGTNAFFSFTSSSFGEFEEISAGTKDTICSSQGGTWHCFALGASTESLGASLLAVENAYGPKAEIAVLEAEKHGAYDVSSSSATIGGQSATCTNFKVHSHSGAFTVCVTSTGQLAKAVGTTSTGHFTVTLQSASSSVPGSTFTPPAPVTSIP